MLPQLDEVIRKAVFSRHAGEVDLAGVVEDWDAVQMVLSAVIKPVRKEKR